MKVGDRIPEILGTDQNGRLIKSSDYAGRKMVLYTYPKANTSGCTAEACSLQSRKSELSAAGYEIVGVSKDKQEVQAKFAQAQGLEFPLIADTSTELLQDQDSCGPDSGRDKVGKCCCRSCSGTDSRFLCRRGG